MPYVVITKDKPDSFDLRMKLRDEHLKYLDSQAAILLAGGAMINDDGEGALGGVLIVDTEARAVAEKFAAADPFTVGGLFEKVTIARWRKAYFDRKRLI